MDLQTRKNEFVKQFLMIENEELIAQFEKIPQRNTQNKLESMSMVELNSRIDQAENDFKNGKFKTSAELLAQYK